MDKARPIIAIALCLVIWAAYFKWFSPKPQPKPSKPPAGAGTEKLTNGGGGAGTNGGAVENGGTPEPKAEFTHPEVAPAVVTIENDTLKAAISTSGASVQRLILKKYGDPEAPKSPLGLLDEFDAGFRSFSLRDPWKTTPVETVNWEVVESGAQSASFRYTQPDGLRIVKTFSLGPEPYALRMRLEVENLSKGPLSRSWELVGAAGIQQEATGGVYPNGAHGLSKGGKTYAIEIDDLDLKELSEEKPWEGAAQGIAWVGVTNKFFACAMIPAAPDGVARYRIFPVFARGIFERRLKDGEVKPGSKEAAELKDWTTNTLGFSAVTADRTWAAGEKSSSEWIVYAGPKKTEFLEQGAFKDQRLGDLLDYGWFWWISRLLLWILHLFHAIFGNYGIAIICLVLVVRMAIYPISKKGQVSMFRMQKLQPQIKEIQAKYKNDPVKTNQETMKMFKEQGVNPFGGCLPLLMQIPVFLGLYNALLYSIDLRQEPFVAWIHDLSRPDDLFKLPFSIFGATHFHLLPIVMIITWFTQAYLQPRSPDPQMAAQQKMFMIMPIVIGFMMYGTPAGLVLYWLVSTAWGIAEQQFIKKTYLK